MMDKRVTYTEENEGKNGREGRVHTWLARIYSSRTDEETLMTCGDTSAHAQDQEAEDITLDYLRL
jgi:hypothetical protein